MPILGGRPPVGRVLEHGVIPGSSQTKARESALQERMRSASWDLTTKVAGLVAKCYPAPPNTAKTIRPTISGFGMMAVPPQSAQHNWVVGSNRAHPLFLKAEKTKLVPTACDRRQSPLASIEMFTCPTYRPVRVTANPMLTLGAVDSGKRQLTARSVKLRPIWVAEICSLVCGRSLDCRKNS